MFSLICAMRNNPKFLPKYTGGVFSKMSNCGVNVRFIFNPASEKYERIDGSWKTVHDHRVELETKCCLAAETMRDIKHWWMDNPNIRVSEIIRRVKENSHQINEKGVSVYLHLKHLDVLNALAIIRGSGQINMEELMQDLQQVQTRHPDAKVEITTATPMSIFFQSYEMQQLHRLYPKVVMLNISKRRKNKYDFYVLKLTGINNFGNSIVFAVGLTNIKCKKAYDFFFRLVVEQAKKENTSVPDLLVLPIENELEQSMADAYGQPIKVIHNQYHFLSHSKDLIGQYRKRLDFDYLHCCNKLDEIVQELIPASFERIKRDILSLVSNLDRATVREFDSIFKASDKWSVIQYKHLYTGGLHSNERAAFVDSFMRVQYKFDSTLLEIVEACKRMQQKDMSLECNSKEAHAYFTHPVYTQMRKRFSQYALSLMLHQLLVSYKYTAFDEEEIDDGDKDMEDPSAPIRP